MADDGHPAQAEQDRPAGRRRGPSAAAARPARAATAARRPPRAGPSAQPREPRRRSLLRVPSIVFRTTLPVNPSVTITSALPASRSRPSMFPVKPMLVASARRRVGLDDLGRALLGLLADREQRDPRLGHAEHGAGKRGAEERELDQVDRAGLGVRPHVQQQGGRPGAAGDDHLYGQRRAAHSLHPSEREQGRGHRRPRRARRSRPRRTAPPRRRAPPSRSRPRGATRTAATGSSSLVISSVGSDQLRAVDAPRLGERSRVAEHPQPDPVGSGGPSAGDDHLWPSLGAAAVEGDVVTGGHREGTTRLLLLAARRLGRSRLRDLVLDHLAARVGAAHRADPMRQPRTVAAGALVEPRRARPVRCSALVAPRP